MAATSSNPVVTTSWAPVTRGETGKAVIQNRTEIPVLVTMHTDEPGRHHDGFELMPGDVFNRDAESTGHIYVKNGFDRSNSGATMHLVEEVS